MFIKFIKYQYSRFILFMKKGKLLISFLLILISIDSFCQSYLNITWDNKTRDLKASDHDLLGLFSNHYVEYFDSKFSDEVYIYETHHIKTKINKITDDLSNEILISKIDVTEIMDIKAKVFKKNNIVYYNYSEIKDFINNVESDDNYNYYDIPDINENDYIEVIYTLKKEFSFYGDKIIEQSYPIQSSKFILIQNNFISNIKIYNSKESIINDTIFDGKKSKIIKFNDIKASVNEQYSTPIANKLRVSYQCNNEKGIIPQSEYWENLVENVKELFFPSSTNPKAIDFYNEILSNNTKYTYEDNLTNLIDEYVKNNFIISDDNDDKLNDINYILENKISNQFSVIKIYTNLLKAAKIEYEVAISCNRYFLKFDPELFNPNQLREFIIYLPNSEKYISPNRIEYRVSEAPDDLLGNYGIFIDSDLDYYFSEITQSDKSFSQIKKKIQIFVPKKLKKLKIKEIRSYSGYWAIMNRNYVYISENEKTDFLVDYFTINGLNNKKINSYNIKNFDLSYNSKNTPLIIESNITTSDLFEKKNGLIYLKIGKVIGMQSNLFDENQRINEIEINFPNSYEYKIEVEIPKGFRVSDYSELNKLKEFISVDGSVSAKFNSKANINNNILYIDIEEFYKNLKYDKGRYQEFREVINTAAKFYNTSIVLEKI